MTYIDLINRFWEAYRVKKFSDIDTAIYFFLLNECNIRRWLNPFELQTRNLEVCLQISRKTIGEARNRLKQRGMIDFIEAQGRGPTIYLIDGVNINNSELYERFCVSDCVSPEKHEGNTNGNTKVTQGLHNGNTTPDSTLLIEERRHKTKDNSVAVATRGAPQLIEPESLFAEEERKAAKKKSPPKPKITFEPPTLDDVRRYFLSQDADKRLENWEESARRFYDNYAAVGWIDKYNRRITRWDSKANSWIIDDEKREKERKQNEQTRTDRPIPPSGGIPIRGKVTPSCGLKRRDPSGET